MTDHRIHHQPGCRTPGARERVGAKGDTLLVCTGCGRYAISRRLEQSQLEAEPLPAAAAATTGRVCPAHPETPVTAQGKGCPSCALERASVEQQRRARRRRRTAKNA